MAYLLRQKFNISDLGLRAQPKKILIFEPEEYLAGIYTQYLKEHFFDPSHCRSVDGILPAVKQFVPHALILNTDAGLSNRFLLELVAEFPFLPLVSTGFNGNERIKEFMNLGFLGHIDRRFSRPKDLVIIVKNILNH